MRENLKLKDKISYLMNNQNETLKQRAQKIIIIGAKEIDENIMTIKIDG